MELDRDVFTPVDDFAMSQGVTTDEVIEMIRDGTLSGRLFEDRWFVDTSAAQTQGYLKDSQGHLHSAEATSSQTQAQQQEREQNGTSEGVPDLAIVFTLRLFGLVAIAFGVIIGLWLLYQSSQSTPFSFFTSEGELTFGEVAMAFSVTLFFCILGAFCLAFAKIIESLEK